MESLRAVVRPFALQPAAGSFLATAALGLAAPVLERAFGLSVLSRLYEEATGTAVVDDFPERALAHLGIAWRATGTSGHAIPAAGPVIIVANHPFGAADGLAVLALARRERRDVRLLGNYLLQRIPEMQQAIIAVDPFGGAQSAVLHRQMMRRAVDWLQRGGALIVFPAGEVAHRGAPGGRLVDSPWKRGVASLVAQSDAPVVPVFVGGRNSALFAAAGRIHPMLRTALLPRELLRLRGRTIDLTVGPTIPTSRLTSLPDATAMVQYLRARTEALDPTRRRCQRPERAPEPIAAARPACDIAREVSHLPDQRKMLRHGDYDVFLIEASHAPAVIQEISRLREVAFRAAGEGTGAAEDRDAFDASYLHLFVWHRKRAEIAGAYRLGLTDRLAAAGGPRALYTRSLFVYGRRFLRALGPAIELGRSFVRVEYQREFSPLLLLWQGIGRFVVDHPQYRRLFGPVSISAAYGDVARAVLVEALEAPVRRSPLARLVRARRPCALGEADSVVRGLDLPALDRLVAELDPGAKPLPVLLRQYLRLGAEVVSTSVDPAFAGVVDALVIVDLDRAPRPLLRKYLGADGLAAFLAAGAQPEAERRASGQ